jgi:uncharacterized protein YheU (UPF0270 family)
LDEDFLEGIESRIIGPKISWKKDGIIHEEIKRNELYELVVEGEETDDIVECELKFDSEVQRTHSVLWEGELVQVWKDGCSRFVFVLCFSVKGDFKFFIRHVAKCGISGVNQHSVHVI